MTPNVEFINTTETLQVSFFVKCYS